MNSRLLSEDKTNEDKLSKDKFEILGCDFRSSNNVTVKNLDYKKLAWMKFKNNKVAIISLFLLIILSCISFSSTVWSADQCYTIEDAQEMNGSNEKDTYMILKNLNSRYLFKRNSELANIRPNSKHIFGTDNKGVDIFSNTFVRLRLSLLLGLITALLNTFIGIIYGAVSGYCGGLTDEIMMRIIEIISSIPSILWITIIVIIIGNSFKALLIAMAMVGWCKTAMIMRGKVCQLREQEFILASKALGADRERVVIGHLLPNLTPLAITSFVNDLPSVMVDEALLSCIGLGVMYPYYTLGKMLFIYTQSNVLLFYPYQVILPSLVLTLVILLLQYVGTALTDALDPKIIY